MAMYLKYGYGFSVPAGPLQFGKEGWRANARRKLRDGDLVLIVGTKAEETEIESERGKLLGLMEPTVLPILSQDYDLETSPHDFDENGRYKWPFGLINRRAWKVLEPRPLLGRISQRRFGTDAAAGIVSLTEPETAAVLRLPSEEVNLLTPVRERARIEGEMVARRRSSPPPPEAVRWVMGLRREPAYTYAMQIEGTQTAAFKIGWAFDYQRRQDEFNQSSMPTLGGLKYRAVLHRLWDTAKQAYEMEQWLLREFNQKRHPANHEVVTGVSHTELESTWIRYLQHHH